MRPPPLRGAGVILRREADDGRRFLLLRNRRGEWGFPKGHIEGTETPEACAIRECAEESGIALLALDGPARELTYDLPDGRRKVVAYFPAHTSQDGVVLSHEHDRFGWAPAATVPELLAFPDLCRLFVEHLAELDSRNGSERTGRE